MSAPSPSEGLADVLREIEDRLENATGLQIRVMDRVDVSSATTEHLAHRGVSVVPQSSTNTEDYRDDLYARVVDTMVVNLTYRVRPAAQRDSRDEALRLEESVRRLLVDSAWQRIVRMAYRDTPFRGAHPRSAEFYLISQVYTTTRDAVLGGIDG